MDQESQIHRVLSMYDRLYKGGILTKRDEANRYGVSEKTIQRDIQNIQNYIAEEQSGVEIKYDRTKKGHVLEDNKGGTIQAQEVYAIVKVLMESRAFPKDQMNNIVKKFMNLIGEKSSKKLKTLINNELYLYEPVSHGKNVLPVLLNLAEAILEKNVVKIYYQREDQSVPKERIIEPVGIIFSEFYFYLMAYFVNSKYDYPTIFRLDRIVDSEKTKDKFTVAYQERFQEGEFKKIIQFMHTGELMKVRFLFTGRSPQAVIDRFPNATKKETAEGYVFETEVFGTGIKFWLLSQGKDVKVLHPPKLVEEMKQSIQQMQQQYE